MIVAAHEAPHLEHLRALFVEYAQSLDFNLCFQSFDRELAELPGAYAPPRGRLYVAYVDGAPAACVAMRPLGERECEMKRLYVKPSARGHALGRKLVEQLVADARALGYTSMRLDTVPAMATAQRLYESLGFRDTPPYTANPVAGARFMELPLGS